MMRRYLLATTGMVALALAPVLSGPAYADTILSFSQSGTASITGTRSGSSTTISATNDHILVGTFAEALPPIPFSAFLTFSITSSSTASLSGSQITQDYSGSFRICSTAANCTAGGHSNVDYLSGTFTSIAQGGNGGTGLLVGGSDPGGQTIAFSSDVIPIGILGNPTSLGLSLQNLISAGGLHITSNTIGNFTSNSVSGNFSSNFVAPPPPPTTTPEPASLAVLGVALAGLGVSRRRRR